MTTLVTETGDLELDAFRPLTAVDRCDSCGAQAYIRAVMPSGELLFCAHHGNRHREKLAPLVTAWHDESDKLLA